MQDNDQYYDLAPDIHRQRLVVEGYPKNKISSDDIKAYLSELSVVLNMVRLNEPVTHQSPKFGWAGWIHWETSGAHFYAWDEPNLFFSVDIYTCKEFSNKEAVKFTEDYFSVSKITYKAF